MTTQHTADYLARLSEAIDAFSDAFDSWMETQVESSALESRGMFPTVWAKDGADPDEVRRRELRVAEAAGFAASAVSVTGAHFRVQGVGLVDPIANWSLMSQPRPMFSPADIRTTVANIRGRLAALQAEAETTVDGAAPGFGPTALHPLIWNASAQHWTSHLRRSAVQVAAEELSNHWRERLDRNDVSGKAFWQEALSSDPAKSGRPRLVWPGDDDDETVKSMREGLRSLAIGLTLAVRNTRTHSSDEPTEQEALEQLGAYSLLARLLDRCEICTADEAC